MHPFAKKVGLSFARAFVATFALGATGVVDAVGSGDLTAARAALVALVLAGVTAGLRAAQVYLTTWESPPAP